MRYYSHSYAENLNLRVKLNEEKFNTHLEKDTHYVIRLDGVGMTKSFYSKPDYKRAFMHTMRDTLQMFMQSENSLRFAYTYSDEISIYLEETFLNKYTYRTEKILSVVASKITAAFYISAQKYGLPLEKKLESFDARIIELPSELDVLVYFEARQAFTISSHLIYLRNTYLNNYRLDNSRMIISSLARLGINYEEDYSKSERFGLIWVNKEYQVPFEFLNDKKRLNHLFYNRNTVYNRFNKKRNSL